ncbi:hypothetical protein L917_19179, partial [Phytophthora nicotianae]
ASTGNSGLRARALGPPPEGLATSNIVRHFKIF